MNNIIFTLSDELAGVNLAVIRRDIERQYYFLSLAKKPKTIRLLKARIDSLTELETRLELAALVV